MVGRGFMEVETPMMQVIPGGASARPFITHHNALNLDMYLRMRAGTVPQASGGCAASNASSRSTVTSVTKGISVRHNPEFTMMELYMAYADYKDSIELTESLSAPSRRTSSAIPKCLTATRCSTSASRLKN